jgi:hypothetical protein
VAFIDAAAYAARAGTAWLWWPGSHEAACGPHRYAGAYPEDWGLLLVLNDKALRELCTGGGAWSHLARTLDIKPFVLRCRDELEAGGVLEFVETLELATPKH